MKDQGTVFEKLVPSSITTITSKPINSTLWIVNLISIGTFYEFLFAKGMATF